MPAAEARPTVELIASMFTGGHKPGDFGWMIEQPEYDDALFIFNDNEHEFRAHQRHAPGSRQCGRGGGNAVIRPYQCQLPRRAAGIPTGAHGGYPRLDDHVRDVIDDALAVIAGLLTSGAFTRVIYSAADEGGDLGTGIFTVGPDVRAYIVDGLRRVTVDGKR